MLLKGTSEADPKLSEPELRYMFSKKSKKEHMAGMPEMSSEFTVTVMISFSILVQGSVSGGRSKFIM